MKSDGIAHIDTSKQTLPIKINTDLKNQLCIANIGNEVNKKSCEFFKNKIIEILEL